MKKILLFTGIMMIFASQVFATVIQTIPSGVGVSLSKNVLTNYESGGTPAAYFAISAKNSQGNKIYGAINTQSSVFQKDGNVGTALATTDNPTVPTTQGQAINTGWTSM